MSLLDAVITTIRVLFAAFIPVCFLAVLVWMERRGCGFIQDRSGPNRANIFGFRLAGIVQNAADGLKLAFKEDVIPDVRLTRSKDGSNGTAVFYFQNPRALDNDRTDDITGMYMIDEEGELVTREVKAKFINGQPDALEATYVMKSTDEWDRFIRFMDRYASENELGFTKS